KLINNKEKKKWGSRSAGKIADANQALRRMGNQGRPKKNPVGGGNLVKSDSQRGMDVRSVNPNLVQLVGQEGLMDVELRVESALPPSRYEHG
ncbi:hypothetical protein Dimus_020623, partial [Dionaea muscipula]